MKRIDRNELQSLIDYTGDLCISIYVPAGRVRRERQPRGPILLKNLVREAEAQVRKLAPALRPGQRQRLLWPARRILRSNGNFWNYQQEGLVFFLAPDFYRLYQLPVAVAPRAVVGRRFYIKPLLSCPLDDRPFYVLALSLNQLRLFRATCAHIEEVALQGMPASLEEALQYDDFEKRFQFRGGASPPGGLGKPAAHFYSHETAGEERKGELLRFCQEVDGGLQRYLHGETAPLLLAGVDYLVAIYRQVNSYSHLLPDSIPGSPERVPVEELHRAASALVEPRSLAPQQEALAAFSAALAAGKASTQLAEILPAACTGRVETLFVAVDREQWGRFQPPCGPVVLSEEAAPGLEALLDLAAFHTLRNKRAVYALPAEEVPGTAGIAALFYY